jgi:hypothetical protein
MRVAPAQPQWTAGTGWDTAPRNLSWYISDIGETRAVQDNSACGDRFLL